MSPRRRRHRAKTFRDLAQNDLSLVLQALLQTTFQALLHPYLDAALTA